MNRDNRYEFEIHRDLTQIRNTKPKVFGQIIEKASGKVVQEYASYDPTEVKQNIKIYLETGGLENDPESYENIFKYALKKDYSSVIDALKFYDDYIEPHCCPKQF